MIIICKVMGDVTVKVKSNKPSMVVDKWQFNNLK